VAILAASAVLVTPSFMYEPKASASRPHLVYRGARQPFPVVVEGGEVYVPFQFIKKVIDPDAFSDNGVVVVTTKDKVIKLKTDSLTAYVNRHPVDLRLPVTLEGGEPYVPASSLELLYPVATSLHPGAGAFVVREADVESRVGAVRSGVPLRTEPSILSRRIAALAAETEVELFDSKGGWVRAQTADGLAGWIPSKCVPDPRTRPAEVPPPKDYVPPPLAGKKLALVWEQVDSRTPDTSTIGAMDGANVVSPTWFRLGENPGDVENYVDARYVRWAHSKGYKVWALFSNSFELKRTRAVLRDSDLRDKVISQILMYAEMYSLDGINLDFENVYQDDGPYLTQFVREITPFLHEMGLSVSIDVTVRSLSPTWSLCYERKRLADVVDYVMLMAYDQYSAGSGVAGPNASIPWTRSCIETTLQEVPAHKLVLGVPFYTRLWKETRDGASVKVTQKALGMDQVQQWLRLEGVEAASQPETGLLYAERSEGPDTYRIWIEDETSMKQRVELARSYGLAGIAAWRRGFESSLVWDIIQAYSR
jgi:spore germination protein YaaH